MHKLPFPLIAPLFALFVDGHDAIFFAGAGDQIPEGSVFGKVIRYRHGTADRVGSVTLDCGWEILLGIEVEGLQQDLSSNPTGGVFTTAAQEILKLNPKGDYIYRQVLGVESFYEGPSKTRSCDAKIVIDPSRVQGAEIHHFRAWASDDGADLGLKFDDAGLSAKGGATVIFIVSAAKKHEGQVKFVGKLAVSVCSLKDNFHRARGTQVALARLEQNAEWKPEENTPTCTLWEAGTPVPSAAFAGGPQGFLLFELTAEEGKVPLGKEGGFLISRELGHFLTINALRKIFLDGMGKRSAAEGGPVIAPPWETINLIPVILSQDPMQSELAEGTVSGTGFAVIPA